MVAKSGPVNQPDAAATAPARCSATGDNTAPHFAGSVLDLSESADSDADCSPRSSSGSGTGVNPRGRSPTPRSAAFNAAWSAKGAPTAFGVAVTAGPSGASDAVAPASPDASDEHADSASTANREQEAATDPRRIRNPT